MLKAREDLLASDPIAQQARVRAIEALSSYAQLPQTLAGIHREHLIRWDGWTSTWIGRSIQTGRGMQIRVIRPEHRQNSAYQRLLEDEANRLRRVYPRISTHWEEWPLILLPMPGHRSEWSTDGDGHTCDVQRLARLLGSGLDAAASSLLHTRPRRQ